MFRKTNHPITPDTDPETYHALSDPAKKGTPEFIMSRTALADFAVCPHKFRHAPPSKVTKAMSWGDVVDCLLLTPDRFDKAFVVPPETYPVKPTTKDPRTEKPWTRKADYCQEWEDEKKKAGLEIIGADDATKARTAVGALLADPYVRDVIDCSHKQVQAIVEWHDDATKMIVPFKILIDLVPEPDSQFGKLLFDVKTTGDAAPEKWQRHVWDQRYYYQAAVYLDAFNAATGLEYTQFANIVQESAPPFEVARRAIANDYIALGRREYRRHLALYCRALANNEWPGYDDWDVDNAEFPVIDGFRQVEAPVWVQKKELRSQD